MIYFPIKVLDVFYMGNDCQKGLVLIWGWLQESLPMKT